MFDAGLDALIPIIPPGASLAPTSKISPDSIGKIPGFRLSSGLWRGGNWREWPAATPDTIRTWLSWGANIGLRTDRFPCVDIDVADPTLADIVEQAALAKLGPAPIRIGNAPKRALAYRTDVPFGKLKLMMVRGGKTYLVEILGQGQQYVVYGTHPKTGRAYEWNRDPAELKPITLEQARDFLSYLQEAVEMVGYECKRTNDGDRATKARQGDQAALEAPSIGELRAAMELIPNDDRFPGWDEYVKMLHACRAAAGPEEEEGGEIFAEWAGRRNNGQGPAVPGEDVRSLWRRTHGPFSLGWPWIAEQARQHGYNDAPFEPEAETEETTPTEGEAAVRPAFLSDQWLAEKVVRACHGTIRYVPAKDTWLVWTRGRWNPDAAMLAEDMIKMELRKIAHWLGNTGAAAAEMKSADKDAKSICSSGTLTAVTRLVKIDRAIAVAPEVLDFNQWILNTPGGIVDLKTGTMMEPDPDQLCTRSTSVAPITGVAPLWQRFLDETTRGDVALQGYLKRLAGYCLTGVTHEQQYTFIYGEGGNGKGTFLGALMEILASYHRDSPMDTFIASNGDRHPTELAHLAGARFVTASETDAGKRWDEPKLKRMTGGDPITARGMREDFFTYIPQFKLVFIGNHRPEIRNLDEAMRRRTHLVPFPFKPAVRDLQLKEKLREEYPQILQWMIDGCLEWQREGLKPPATVLEATEEYFSESDTLGAWLAECTAPAPGEWIELVPLFDSWESWCGRRNERPGRSQTFSSRLAARGYTKRLGPKSRRAEFSGLTLNTADPLKGMVAE